MAITIKSAPQASGFISANEDVWHVVDSTNKDVIGFKYIFDLYKGGNLLTRITNSPYGDDGYGVINVGNIVRSTVAVDTMGFEFEFRLFNWFNKRRGRLLVG